MAKFITELEISLKPDSDKIYILDFPLIYKSDVLGTIKVPKEFYTDFASVPRVPIAYMFFGDRAHREAVLHDYLYRLDSKPQATYMEANRVFLEAMYVRKKSFVVRYIMYLGVVLGGWASYHKRKVEDIL
jgi:hypothetical protein